ncbi:hypothetical protein SESBI_42824 [Sesbania bispinosa]|nr:hypothetical protein SESBI_42824 [Sesbania bispinosa]
MNLPTLINLQRIRTPLQDKRVGVIIRPNTSTNHGIIGAEPIKDTCNGVSADESVPQEGTARICNAALEEKKGS